MAEKKKLMSVSFYANENDEITVSTKFPEAVPVAAMYELFGVAIRGLLETAQKIGKSKGLTDEQVLEEVLGKEDPAGI